MTASSPEISRRRVRLRFSIFSVRVGMLAFATNRSSFSRRCPRGTSTGVSRDAAIAPSESSTSIRDELWHGPGAPRPFRTTSLRRPEAGRLLWRGVRSVGSGRLQCCGAMGCGASRVRVAHPDRSLTCSHGELETALNGRKGNPVVRSSLNGIPGRIQRVVLRVRTFLSKMHDATR